MADQHFLRVMKKHLKDYSITGELHSDSYCSNFICRHRNDNYIVTIIAINPNLRNSVSMTPNALTQVTFSSDFFIKNRYALKASTDLFSLADIESYKMWKNEYWVRKIEENKLIELAGSQTDIAATGEGYNGGWIPPFPPPSPTPTPRPLIRIPTWAAAVVLLAVVGFGFYKFMGDQPASYIDPQGNTVQALSRSEMADAYTLGMQYYEQGNYENAITELNKVTKKSGKYEEAQAAMVAAMTAYKDGLIEKSESYCAGGNFEMALSILESGTALLGENNDLLVQQQNVLNQLKVYHINKSSEAEQSGGYAAAFSYIQTARAFLPNDVELEGLYTRLDAMSKAETALADAERYKMAGDYPKLFSSLDDAMDKVSGSTVALSKITLAYDEYKTAYLSEVEQKISNPVSVDEYTRAIETLDIVVEIFPDEYELKQQLESFQTMKVALEAIVKAEDYYKNGDYKNLFAVLEKVMIEVKLHDESYDQVTKTYNAYKNTYIDDLYSQIGEPETIGEFNNAILLLENAIQVLPNDAELKTHVSTLKNTIPVDMFSLNLIETRRLDGGSAYEIDLESDEYLKYHQRVMDNFGNTYNDAVVMSVVDHNAGGYYRRDCYEVYITYDCMEYATLNGIIAIADSSKSYTGDMDIIIYGYTDSMKENILFEQKLSTKLRPQKIKIGCVEYSLIKISLICNSRGELDKLGSVILSDFTLSK